MGWLRCYRCKEQFGLLDEVEAQLRRSGAAFHCPWGHSQVFAEGETEEDKLRRERNQLKQQLARKDDEIRDWKATANDQRHRADKERHRANGYKGHATRISKRVKAGVCICCNRTFQDLQRHMASKHPTFTPIEVEGEPASVN
jgi:hypothetical protein